MTWRAGLIAVAVLVIYGPHIAHGRFVYEDGVWQMTAQPFLGPRGLASASWWLWPTPVALHAGNVLLFGVLLWLVWHLSRRLGSSQSGAYAAAALLAVHPIAIESVAYAASRTELLAAVGIVGACVASLAGRWSWACVALLIGIGGKDSAVVALGLVPLVLIACGRWRLAPTLGAGVAVAAVLIATVDVLVIANLGEAPGMAIQPQDWGLTQAAAVGRLVFVSVTGTGMTVDPDIDRYAPGTQVAAVLGLIALGTVGVGLWAWWPLVALGLLWCLLALLPRFIVQTPRSYINEHQFLVPFLGLVLSSSAMWDRLRVAWPRRPAP